MTRTTRATSIHKVRRDCVGGKRGAGHELQRQKRRVRRPDCARIHMGASDTTLTGVAGLAQFGRFAAEIGLDRELRKRFGDMKVDPRVAYPMPAQLRLLLDAQIAGETRVFGLEALAGDRLFVHLAGGTVPSIDTVYRDLCRFDEPTLRELEDLMAEQSFALLDASPAQLHVDIDTTVEPLFGSQEGALVGPNPRYRGRPSYHPLLASIAEVGTCIGAELRPGDRGFGACDVDTIMRWLSRLRTHVGAQTLLTVRMDSAGDCAELMQKLDESSVRFVIKLRATPDLLGAALNHTNWHVTQRDGDTIVERVAVLNFQRVEWNRRAQPLRVIAVRSTERGGQQLRIWENCDESVQFYVTNDWLVPIEDIPREYDGRAEVEPIIGDLKHGLGIGDVPTRSFVANHAMFLLKLITHNLLRRFAGAALPRAFYWRTPWLQRVLICRPGRLLRSGRQWTLRMAPTITLPMRS